jgi:hypothetical protein
MMPRYRVTRGDLAAGIKEEQKEHPTLSERNVRRVARDHIERYGPGYYGAEKVTEKIVEAKTKQMGAKPIVKRRRKPYDPMSDGIPRDAVRFPF